MDITSEQLIQESFDARTANVSTASHRIQDLDELRAFQLRKRKEFEQQLNKNRLNYRQWIRYARWEIDYNRDFRRARSIMERALSVDPQYIPFWTLYIHLELGHKNINHARNLLDRATTTLPRNAKLWFVYVQTEEALKNYAMVRNIFERWLRWDPDSAAWDAYVHFEMRYDEIDRVRALLRRYAARYPEGTAWEQWADFELAKGDVAHIRAVFETAANTMLAVAPNCEHLASITSRWAQWEASQLEYERARAIYTLLVEDKRIGPDQRERIRREQTTFERRHGDSNDIAATVMEKRRDECARRVTEHPLVDAWWAYLDVLDETHSDTGAILARAVEQVPSHVPGKKSVEMRRYAYLWIRYGMWAEFTCGDEERAREVWRNAVATFAKQKVAFAKVWIAYAEFELRTAGLSAARAVLGRAIGVSAKPKIFKFYITLERRLGHWDRVRRLYSRWLEVLPSLDVVFEYIDFERDAGEHARVDVLFEVGREIEREGKEKTEKSEEEKTTGYQISPLFHKLIEYLKDEMRYDDARERFERELEANGYPSSVFIALALFESSILTAAQRVEYDAGTLDEAVVGDEHRTNLRAVFERAENYYRIHERPHDRLVVLQAWRSYEGAHGTEEKQKAVDAKMPVFAQGADGQVEYVFPLAKPDVSRFMANAMKWKGKGK